MPVEANLLPDRYGGPQRIGHGGMGDIYRATDKTLGRAVAVKILAERYSQDESIRRRFMREALAAARLSGEANTVTIYDVGEWNERPFIVMEYLGGGSIEDRVRAAGRVDTAEALAWLEEAATALDAAHRHGVVHRDVKPANLLLDRANRVHVADFGIASAAGLDSLTITGMVLGTMGYISPEQARGERATPASDIYSLAVVAWELLAGERPFESDSPTAEAAAHVHARVPSISAQQPELPVELDDVFRKALAKEPGARHRTAAELVADLRHALAAAAGQTQIMPPPPAPEEPTLRPVQPTRRGRSRRPLLAALALLAAGGGIAAGVVLADDSGGRHAEPTVTTQVTTVSATVTRAAPTTTAPTTAAAAAPTNAVDTSADGATLNNRGYALQQQGRYSDALPLLRAAVAKLEGSGRIEEAYANYNLGYTLLKLGHCAEAIPHLDHAARIEGNLAPIRRARVAAQRCN
jgi:serine/threonine-protein kinase